MRRRPAMALAIFALAFALITAGCEPNASIGYRGQGAGTQVQRTDRCVTAEMKTLRTSIQGDRGFLRVEVRDATDKVVATKTYRPTPTQESYSEYLSGVPTGDGEGKARGAWSLTVTRSPDWKGQYKATLIC